MHQTLIRAEALRDLLGRPGLVLVDCRFSLLDPERGAADYARAHLPGAVYAHLDRDLAGPVAPGRTGRHPLPEPSAFEATLRRWGVEPDSQVVAYDDRDGAIAARLWWLLHWAGLPAAAVLEGGWQAWTAAALPTSAEAPTPAPGSVRVVPQAALVAGAEAVEACSAAGGAGLLDARAPERYRGDVEPIDPVAGHIPGARNAPYAGNLDADGRFLAPERLRARLEGLLEGVPAAEAICYCGSGVTAAHNALAFRHAGLGMPRLYPGSWSEWITRPERGAALGEAP